MVMIGHVSRFLRQAVYVAALTWCIGATAAAPGALLRLTDGTRYEGRLVQRSDAQIVFEIHIGSVRFTRTFTSDQVAAVEAGADAPLASDGASEIAPARDDLAHVDPPANRASAAQPGDSPSSQGPTYMLLPLHGTFGEQVDGPIVARCLDHARQVQPDVVIVRIDSPGGMLDTLVTVAEALGNFQRDSAIPVVAFVDHNALSAAALTAMSIRSIYIAPDGTIGAALLISYGPGGAVSSVAADGDVAEKFLSVFRARVRGWVQQAGHDPLLSEAMVDPSLELYLLQGAAGDRRLLRGPIDQRDAADRTLELIIAQGRLLTLTASDALHVGLVDGVVSDLDELGAALGMSGWRPIDDVAEQWMTERATTAAQVRSDYERTARGLVTTLGQVVDGSASHPSAQERAVAALRSRIARIERLVEEHPFLLPQAMADFPGGLTALKFRCDEVLREIREARRDFMRQRR